MLDTFCRLGQNSDARQIVAEQSREISSKNRISKREVIHGVVRDWQLEGFLRAADVAKQNVVIDRVAGYWCSGILLYWSLLYASSLKHFKFAVLKQ
jgi:hypothetical protein